MVNKLMAIAFTVLFFAACRKDAGAPSAVQQDFAASEPAINSAAKKINDQTGYVYSLSNQADANKVIVYRRDTEGKLRFIKSWSTGGKGTGAGLASQGSVILADDNILLAVNAGSNSISSFRVSHDDLQLISIISSGGSKPLSIAQYHNLVYVLNAGEQGNIAGFRISGGGKLIPVPHSVRPLSSKAADPAQVSFVNEGTSLVITEKATNKIITYTVSPNGVPGAFHSLSSANATPFGFATADHGKIYVSEAAGGAAGASSVSAYRVDYNGAIRLIEGPVSAGQTAACWVVVSENGKYIYATNTGSNTVSSFAASASGRINKLEAVAAPTGTTPIDAALSGHSRFLYALNANGHSISAFKVDESGSLHAIQTVPDLLPGTSGLAAQ